MGNGEPSQIGEGGKSCSNLLYCLQPLDSRGQKEQQTRSLSPPPSVGTPAPPGIFSELNGNPFWPIHRCFVTYVGHLVAIAQLLFREGIGVPAGFAVS